MQRPGAPGAPGNSDPDFDKSNSQTHAEQPLCISTDQTSTPDKPRVAVEPEVAVGTEVTIV